MAAVRLEFINALNNSIPSDVMPDIPRDFTKIAAGLPSLFMCVCVTSCRGAVGKAATYTHAHA